MVRETKTFIVASREFWKRQAEALTQDRDAWKEKAKSWQTECNIWKGRTERLERHRDRSMSPLRIQALSEQARAALDVVCKRDEADRITEQRTIIAEQAMEIQKLRGEKETMRTQFLKGDGIVMGPIWRAYQHRHPEMSLEYFSPIKKQTLHEFLHETATKLIALQKLQESVSNALQGVALDFPVEVVESDSEASD
jgi:hypothetical protein